MLELATDFEATITDQDDLSKENDQQTKTIKHLQTRIKLLEKSQSDLYKSNGQMERENKTLKGQVSRARTNFDTLIRRFFSADF